MRNRRDRAVLAVMIGGGLVAAGVNTSAPVDLATVDALYRAGFVAAGAWLAVRARRWTWVVVSAAAAVATASFVGQLVAVAALGAAAYGVVSRRHDGVLGAAIVAASIPALLAQGEGPLSRLTGGAVDDPFGTSAVVTVLAVSPVLVSGWRRLGRRRRRSARRAARHVAAALALVLVTTTVALALAGPSLLAGGRATAEAVERGSDGDMASAVAELDAAASSWRSAHGRVSGPWMIPGRLVPVLGQHVRAVQVVSGQAQALTVSAATVAERVETDDMISGGRVDVDRLEALSPALDALAETSLRAEQRLGDAGSPWLVPPLGRALSDGLEEFPPVARTVDASAAALRIAVDRLGGTAPASVVVMFTTPSEARGAGGFVGSWAEFRVDGGAVRLVSHRRSKALNDLLAANDAVLVADADYTERYGRFAVERHIQDVTISPDFPSVAAVAADLYEQATGVAPAAMVMIDPFVLETLLTFTGPVDADPTVTLTAADAAEVLLRRQYELFAADEDGRERMLDILAAAVVQRLLDRPPDPFELASELAPRADEGRFALWLADDDDGTIVADLGLDAGFPDVSTDLISVVHQNGGQNKIDAHLRRELDLATVLHPGENRVEHALTITLHNDAPAVGLPAAVIGSNDQGLPAGTNRLTLSVYSPLGVERARVDGVPAAVEAQTEFGVGVYSITLAIPPRSSTVVELDLRGPADLSNGYEMVFDPQPLVRPDALTWLVSRGDGGSLEPPEGFVADGESVLLRDQLDRPRRIVIETGRRGA